MLGYVSDLPQAISMGTSAADPELNGAIRTLNDSGLYTIARISCFKDNRAPRMDNSLAIRMDQPGGDPGPGLPGGDLPGAGGAGL